MAKYVFSNLIGGFVFNEKFHLEESILFKTLEDFNNKKIFEDKLIKKYGNVKKATKQEIPTILNFFKNKKYYSEFHGKNLLLTKKQIKDSVNEDLLIMQTINNLKDIDKVSNILVKRLREWYELYNPELSKAVFDQEQFADLIIKKSKKELLKQIKITEDDSMGASLAKKDVDEILLLAKQVNNLHELRKKHEDYLEDLMKKYCPNLKEVAGAIIGARLLEHAGSLKRLMEFPASTVQILGAEKALFRHLKNKKARPPKYGILFQHPLISKSNKKNHGKVARALADKISIAVKVDYFKGKFVGLGLKKGLERRFK